MEDEAAGDGPLVVHGSAAAPARDARTSSELVLVAISSSPNSIRLVEAAARLARTLGASWEAIHIETPAFGKEEEQDRQMVGKALAVAAKNGAAIARIPAATVADGIDSHLAQSPATHLVLGRSRTGGIARLWQRSVAELVVERYPDLALHLLPPDPEAPARRRGLLPADQAPALHYAYALILVGFTLAVATGLQRATGMRGLDLLFLFPAIFVAARLGLRPALLTVVVSVLGYNLFLLGPAFRLRIGAPENALVLGVLLAVSTYVSILTAHLRARVALSDRSAQENAAIAAFALRLTSLSDWAGTAQAVCEQVATMLKVNAMLFREVEGQLVVAGAAPEAVQLSPLSRAALDWAWSHGEPAGNSTGHLSAAEWRLQPLRTSLGTLAVLAIAKDLGGDPVPADRSVLFSTLVAQAALAHERLRLEDQMRG